MQLELRSTKIGTRLDLLDPANEKHLLLEAVDLVRRRITFIAAVTLLALAAAMVYVLVTPPVYVAQAELLIEPRRNQAAGAQLGGDSNALDAAQLENQITLLQSEQIIGMVTDDLKLANDPEVGSASAPAVGAVDKELELRRKRQLVDDFQRRLRVSRVGTSYTVSISYRSGNPAKAATIANGVADAYLRDQLLTHARLAKEGSQWLEERLEELRRKMKNEVGRRGAGIPGQGDYRIAKLPEVKPTQEPQTNETTLEDLEVKASTYRKIYESHMQAYFDLVHERSRFSPNARVITHASLGLGRLIPARTSSSRPLHSSACCWVSGLPSRGIPSIAP